MRIFSKVYNVGDKRIIRGFAFIPLSVSNGKIMERRWWEHVTVEQKLIGGFDGCHWETLRFIDDEE